MALRTIELRRLLGLRRYLGEWQLPQQALARAWQRGPVVAAAPAL
jgi:hypothetical protein